MEPFHTETSARTAARSPRMVIYAKEGTIVQYRYPECGYEDHKITARKHLKLNKCYTVDDVDIGSSYSYVYLKEIPGVGFNSVMFEDIPQPP